MSRGGWFRVCVLFGVVLAACPSSTHVGGYACYPDNADPADAEFCLWVDIEGSAERAFVERSLKTIRLSILNSQQEVVLEREYNAEAGELRWFSMWPELSDLQIVFFEYGDPTTSTETASGPVKLPRQVFTTAFTYHELSGAFVEALAPSAVLEEASRYDDVENTRHIIEISFRDSAETETRILEEIRELSISRGLQAEEPQAGIIGRLAEYSAPSFSLVVQRHNSLGQLAVVVQDYGNRELTKSFADKLRDLPAVVRTRHHASINFRLGPRDLETVVRSVEAVAKQYGLSKGDQHAMSDVATYGSGGLEVTITHFEGGGKVKISVEDSEWNAQFEEIEDALRSEFGGGGNRGDTDSR